MSNWQPMETAPKDGTWVLVITSYRGGTFQVVRNLHGIAWKTAMGAMVANPRFWMPLPEPPDLADSDQEPDVGWFICPIAGSDYDCDGCKHGEPHTREWDCDTHCDEMDMECDCVPSGPPPEMIESKGG